MNDAGLDLSDVPLFPLPNVVLFPRAILPLHIFEDRYKQMTADALDSDKLIAMALLRPGWEKDYYNKPEIEPLVCVGQILSWEKLPDGKYNFLLQGRARARVVREAGGRPYRCAELSVMEEIPALDIDLEHERARMLELFSVGVLGAMPIGRQFQELIGGPLSTSDIADLAAFNLLEETALKQALLGEMDVRKRVGTVVEALRGWVARFNPALHGYPTEPGVN